MRRKSRILLCFAVLWVLGIAYYFYTGTAMSRKVSERHLTPFSEGDTGCVSAFPRTFSHRTIRGVEGFGALSPLRSPTDRLPFFSRGCTDAERTG